MVRDYNDVELLFNSRDLLAFISFSVQSLGAERRVVLAECVCV